MVLGMTMSKMKELTIEIAERLNDEVKQGFECKEEMIYMFKVIASEYKVPETLIWDIYAEYC